MGGERRPVVVGVDGGDASGMAVRWALADARSRRAPLRLVHVRQAPSDDSWDQPPWRDGGPPLTESDGLLEEALAEVRARPASEVTVTGARVDGSRVGVLVSESELASVLVVGARGLGRLTGAVLGSVSSAVAARASCPVVVVRGLAGYPEGHVVVGLDGGNQCERVLEYAFDHASRHRLPLRAVLCRRPTTGATPSDRQGGDSRARASHAMAAAMAGWQDKYPDVPVERHVLEGHPVDCLLEEALQAHLLVVGARGRNALPGTLLGSVSQGVLHHATSPVAVVHSGGEDIEPG